MNPIGGTSSTYICNDTRYDQDIVSKFTTTIDNYSSGYIRLVALQLHVHLGQYEQVREKQRYDNHTMEFTLS